ncbi:monooxygenase [Luteimicrobium album]|uniref:Monooxygenase n=1 Tax=Luteimicrobium album TaxID=1054550 RepID=A0ABQ6I4L1_9MICO|nr:LLM class flavin-dependent oxidoreductase [Luteimicrobium album]GMA25417.1 monooxygenase [Luteimicrobium album]
MTTDLPRITRLAFLTPGNFPDDDPATGLEHTLQVFEAGERLGYGGAWVRQRHLEHGVSSAVVFLAAASQRTTRVELGTAVIPVGYESPWRLAEDVATADVLSGRRLQVGLSAGTPPHVELIGERVFDGDWSGQDFSHARIERLAENLRSEYLGDEDTVVRSPGNVQRPRLQPRADGIVDRLWYGAGSWRSTAWAARTGLNLLSGNIVAGEDSDDFATQQRLNVRRYREQFVGGRTPRVALGRVVLPLDGADRATRRRYLAYEESRRARTLGPQGERRTLFARDLVGTSEQILEALAADVALREAGELRLELPYELERDDYEQILTDVATAIAPALGWRPEDAAPASRVLTPASPDVVSRP